MRKRKSLTIQQLFGVQSTKTCSEPVASSSPIVQWEPEAVHPVAVQPRLRMSTGRPVVGPRRGVAAGGNTNKRQLHEKPLRREPSLPVRLAVASKVGKLVSDWGSRAAVPRSLTEHLERDSGWLWKRQMRQWWESRQELSLKLAELKIGQSGLRPFGSNLAKNKRQSLSLGCRLRSGDKQVDRLISGGGGGGAGGAGAGAGGQRCGKVVECVQVVVGCGRWWW